MSKNKKILIIDDDPDFVDATRIVLESENYKVLIASGPDEGFKKVDEEKPDLILLDVLWPDKKSGFDVCRELKDNANYKNIPIIMLTSVDDKYGLGFENVAGDETWLPSDDFLTKPVEPKVLLSKVDELL
ncbi:MAG TPA: response regulator [bacterium]|nr:response regulator [bacterium]